jgi:hypothetical protein
MSVRLVHRVIGDLHVFTSPDVPGLYAAHPDKETAEKSVPEAIEMLQRMEERRRNRERTHQLYN